MSGVRLYSRGQIVFSYAVTAFVLAFSLFPISWVLLSSLKADPMALPGFMLPDRLCFDGYVTLFRDMGIMRYFGNSLTVATLSVLASISMITMSAYVVARIPFGAKGLITVLMTSTLFIPATAMTYPVYKVVRDLGLYNEHAGLILIYACGGIAVSFFVIRSYFTTIPVELENAAMIDGCGMARTFWHIMLPIAMPGILTAAVLAFLGNWNEYYWSSLILIDPDKLTVPALLSNFTTSFETNYNGLFSAIIITILPPILLYCCCSRFFIKALSGGAIKG